MLKLRYIVRCVHGEWEDKGIFESFDEYYKFLTLWNSRGDLVGPEKRLEFLPDPAKEILGYLEHDGSYIAVPNDAGTYDDTVYYIRDDGEYTSFRIEYKGVRP